MVEVGGRGGASGGRGRLRLRALNGLVALSSTPCYLLTRCGGLKRLPPLPPRHGCLDACLFACPVGGSTDLGRFAGF